MPKIRDLGINVIPETMRPPEIGAGGGGGGETYTCPQTYYTCPTGSGGGYQTYTCAQYAVQPGGTCPTGSGVLDTQTCGPYYAYAVRWTCPTGSGTRPTDTCTPAPFPQPQPVLTREAIEQLKQQLHQQIALLDEYAKAIGPKTIAEIDAREKQLQAELEDLARRRKEYKGSE